MAKELLTDSGSIFVQISDENIHRVRVIMDEVFGSKNFQAMINFRSMSPLGQKGIARIYDYILWYAKDIEQIKFRPMFYHRDLFDESEFSFFDRGDGTYEKLSRSEIQVLSSEELRKVFKRSVLTSSGYTPSCTYDFEYEGKDFSPLSRKSWRTTLDGTKRLSLAKRLLVLGKNLYYRQYHNDFPLIQMENSWTDTAAGFSESKRYIVETNPKIIQRCLLMTTDPGDLVLDPTCGSGTTAYVAEQYGRRWITIDTSRVAVALARQRLLASSFEYYELKDESQGITGGFVNKNVPHITLKSIAQNTALDPIFAKHEAILRKKLETLNSALKEVTQKIRTKLLAKLAEKETREGKRSITDADRRRWQLPDAAWQEWEMPFDTDPDWPEPLQNALTDYLEAWRAKMNEVNACIAASSEGEELVDQPEVDRKRIRVSGPFTVEAVQPAEESLDLDSPIGGEPIEDMDTYEDKEGDEAVNAEAYLDKMIRLLKNDGVRFAENKTMKFATLDPIEGDVLHAEGEWETDDKEQRLVAVVFGPQHGPVTSVLVEECLPIASRRGYDELVFAGFSFDGASQAIIQEDPNPRVRAHMAYINPDVAMGKLLKETPTSQLFTVFGLPRTELKTTDSGEYIVKMEDVDIYNPVDNTVNSAGADKVAAWFVDSDYNGRDFCITQAFFPDKSAWTKIARDLKGVVDPECFEKFSGTESLPFAAGEHACVAVKVIDPRGNEVMRVHALGEREY